MKHLNKVFLIGNIGSDVELRHTSNGTPVASMSVATKETWTSKDGTKKSLTIWHKVTAWKELAKICAMLFHKGSKIYLEGKLQDKEWTDKKTGEDRTSKEILATNVICLDDKSENHGNKKGVSFDGHVGADEDTPF